LCLQLSFLIISPLYKIIWFRDTVSQLVPFILSGKEIRMVHGLLKDAISVAVVI
jgi:hypothetical protein